MLQGVYKALGQLRVSTATGGSTTTIVDTKRVGTANDDDFRNGVAFVVRDAGGASAAPEGEFNRISAYVDSTGTFTVDTAYTAAPASGDTYAWANQQYPIYEMIQAMNDGLRLLGDVPLVDTTTLDTAAAQTEYAAAVAWKRRRPYRIDIQGRTGDANDNQWLEVSHGAGGWYWVPAAAGSTGLIVFDFQPPTSLDMRIWYADRHPVVNAYGDVINERIEPELAVLAGKMKALEWQVARTRGADQFVVQMLNDTKLEFDRRRLEEPIEKPRAKSKILVLASDDDEDEFTTPAAA